MFVRLEDYEAIWLRKLLVRLFKHSLEPIVIHFDNLSCIKIFDNPMFHNLSKHIDIQYHLIIDCVQRGKIRLPYIPTAEQTVNILTKTFPGGSFNYFKDKLGVV